jgi:hypothetical protein
LPKSILEISIKDESFKAFLALYQKYQEEVINLKKVWDQTGESIEKATEAAGGLNTDAVTDSAKATAAAASSMADAFASGVIAASVIYDTLNKTQNTVSKTESSFGKIAQHSKNIAGSIFGASRDFAKFAVFGAGAGIIGTGGSLFGLDTLANSASGQLRSSAGLGVSAGEMNSFGTNLGRLVDPSMLGNVQSAQQNNAMWSQFARLGITPQQFQTMDPAQLSALIIGKVKNLIHPGNGVPIATQMQLSGLTGLVSQQDVNRILNTSQSNVNSDLTQYQAGVGTMGADKNTLTAWQQFQVNLETAGKEIETVLIKGLVPLVGPLGHLTQSVEKALSGFLGSPNLQIWIDDLATGIQSLSKYLGSPQFISDMKTFAVDVGDVAQGLEKALKWLGLIPSPSTSGPPGAPPVQTNTGPSAIKSGMDWRMPWTPGYGYDLSGIAKKYGINLDEMNRQATQESGFHAHPHDSLGKHGKILGQGMFQLSPDVQKMYGVTDPYNASQNARGAAMYMRDLLKKYQGNQEEAYAAFDWGPRNLDEDIAKHGKNWGAFAPTETQNYVRSVVNGVTIKIMNQTGAQTAIIANAMVQ